MREVGSRARCLLRARPVDCHTPASFRIGSIGVIAILIALYAVFW